MEIPTVSNSDYLIRSVLEAWKKGESWRIGRRALLGKINFIYLDPLANKGFRKKEIKSEGLFQNLVLGFLESKPGFGFQKKIPITILPPTQ